MSYESISSMLHNLADHPRSASATIAQRPPQPTGDASTKTYVYKERWPVATTTVPISHSTGPPDPFEANIPSALPSGMVERYPHILRAKLSPVNPICPNPSSSSSFPSDSTSSEFGTQYIITTQSDLRSGVIKHTGVPSPTRFATTSKSSPSRLETLPFAQTIISVWVRYE